MKRFICFFVVIFFCFLMAAVGVSPDSFKLNTVKAEESSYSISYNSSYGMYQGNVHGTSKDVLSWCLFDMYCHYGGGVIVLDSDIYVTSHIDIATGNFYINGNNHRLINCGPTIFAFAQDNILKVGGDAKVTFNNVIFDGADLCYNSAGLPGSLIELNNGCPNVTLNGCIVCKSKNLTAFDSSQPLGGGTGINAWYGNLICNNTSFDNISGACIYESEGGDLYSKGQCNVTLNNCTSNNVSGLFASGESLVSSHTLVINGGDYKCGGSSVYVTYCLGIDSGIGNPDSVMTIIKNARIYSEDGVAVVNRGNMIIEESDISSKCFFASVNNNTKMSIVSGKICDSFLGVYNIGELNICGGSICNNTGYGIYNNGYISQSGGNIYSNSGDTPEGKMGAIYQNGTYYIKDKGKISSNNSVLLAGQHIIDVDYKYMDIDSKSTLENYTPIVLTLESKERAIGRKLVNVRGISSDNTDNYQSLFTLAFTNPNYNNNGQSFNGVKNSACIRSGNKIYNCTSNCLYLSGRYYLYYDNSFEGYNKTKLNYSRGFDEFYWLENADIDFSSISYGVDFEGNDVTNSFLLKSFVIDGVSYPILNTHFTDSEKWNSNRTCKGIFDVRFNIDFDGNGGKTLDDKTDYIAYNVDSNFTFPDYMFYKESDKRTFSSLIDGKEKDNIYNYSQQGWSARNDAVYKDNDNMKKGDSISMINNNLTCFLLDILENENTIIKDGIATVKYFATWDEYPLIDNIDIAIPIEDLDMVDEEYLINKARVTSIDKEDNGNVAIKIEDFNNSELDNLKVGEAITFNLMSIDGVSNITYAPLTIRISSNKPIKRRTNIRYVDLDNINTIEDEGGLMENSKWLGFL